MTSISLERWGRNTLARLIGAFLPVQKVPPEAVRGAWSQGRIHKVLLVRPHQGLGDLLLASPIFRALKTSSHVQVDFLADSYNQLAVRHNPHLDKVWVWDKKAAFRPFDLRSFLRGLRAEQYDLAIIVSSHIPSFTSFLLARASGAKIIWAYDTGAHYDGANWSRWLAHVELPNLPAGAPEWEKFMDLIRPLGLEPDCEPEFSIRPDVTRWAEERWRSLRLPANRPAVGLFLGGNPDRPERLWPVESWVELARKLLAQDHVALLAIVPPAGMVSGSGRAEPGSYEAFCRQLGERVPVISDPDLDRVAALLKGLALFICPDGGLMHVAIASRVPTLGLCFETDPSRWIPPVPWAAGLRAPDGKPSGLSPELVFRQCHARLAAVPAARQGEVRSAG